MSGNKTRLFFGCVFVLTLILSAVNGWADESFDHERMDSAGLASALREGLYTESLDSAGVTAWRALMTTLKQQGEILHARRVAWICLFHPLAAGRKAGAMELINMVDLSDPQEVSALLAIDNDCLRNMFVELTENGYFTRYAIAPQIAELLEDENYLRRNRQGRLVHILRALYHYTDNSVVSRVAKYLDDPSNKVREISARTLGKITGHTFSKTGDMDLTPTAYYVNKAKVWWSINKNRPEYTHSEKRQKQHYNGLEAKKQIRDDGLRIQVARLQATDFLVWTVAFNRLLEFGMENESALVKSLQEDQAVSPVNSAYREILMRLVTFYNGKRKTTSEYRFRNSFDIKEFCY